MSRSGSSSPTSLSRGGHADVDVGMRALEGFEPRDQPERRERREGRDADDVAPAPDTDLAHGRIEAIERGRDVRRSERCAVAGDLDVASAAHEERRAELGFERADLAADRRLRQMQLFGGGPEVEQTRDRLEGADRTDGQRTVTGVAHHALFMTHSVINQRFDVIGPRLRSSLGFRHQPGAAMNSTLMHKSQRSGDSIWSLPAQTSRTLRVGPGARVLQVAGGPALADDCRATPTEAATDLWLEAGRERRAGRWSRSRDGGWPAARYQLMVPPSVCRGRHDRGARRWRAQPAGWPISSRTACRGLSPNRGFAH